MAAQKLSPKARSNTTGVPKGSFSGILPNLPIQFSEGVLANAKPRSLTEREVLFEGGDSPMDAIGLGRACSRSASLRLKVTSGY